ncbi:MAG: type 1 fimbriae regulatory protein FimB [Thermoanaerobaculia bacterium]|jgi:site-specific recombinase XerD|nr:type 1 fimbriae regulatory protein FimB [Thermoanaerobaculia bacterium]
MFLTKNVNIARDRLTTARGIPIVSDIPKYHVKEEVLRFFHAIPEDNLRDRVLFDLTYRQGLRRREAAELRLDQIDLTERTIMVKRLKRSRSGVYELHDASIHLLRAYLPTRVVNENPYLFPGRRSGSHISPTTVYYTCRKYARSAGLRRTNPHAFRHSCGVHAANAGLDLIDIADLLGHRSLATAMRYASVSNKRRDESHRRIVKSGEFAKTF